ncbi:MAG: helix-turn-helix transcriptional regulator [Proteobacteria bacterium]|nr:helix-turn-helix transcriptional regulator [Pseudomonadota bacterium]
MPATWDPAFRPQFYERWGRESAVISARARRVEYPAYRQLLSIKAAFGGAEEYFLDGHRVSVDDDTFAIINAGRSYGSRIESLWPVHSFSIFFDAGLVDQVWSALSASVDEQLDDHTARRTGAGEFAERLYEHDRIVSPVLRHIRGAVDAGVDEPHWLDEQLQFLLARMLKLQHRHLRVEAAIPSSKPATRRELLRRLGRGVDFIHARYRDPIALKDIAAAAHLSPFHFLRTFKSVYRLTPSHYLNRKRAAAALRLLQDSDWTMAAIAEQVGFGSRTSLFRHLRAEYSVVPQRLRKRDVVGPGPHSIRAERHAAPH